MAQVLDTVHGMHSIPTDAERDAGAYHAAGNHTLHVLEEHILRRRYDTSGCNFHNRNNPTHELRVMERLHSWSAPRLPLDERFTLAVLPSTVGDHCYFLLEFPLTSRTLRAAIERQADGGGCRAAYEAILEHGRRGEERVVVTCDLAYTHALHHFHRVNLISRGPSPADKSALFVCSAASKLACCLDIALDTGGTVVDAWLMFGTR